jgi:hypothetical protein
MSYSNSVSLPGLAWNVDPDHFQLRFIQNILLFERLILVNFDALVFLSFENLVLDPLGFSPERVRVFFRNVQFLLLQQGIDDIDRCGGKRQFDIHIGSDGRDQNVDNYYIIHTCSF